MTTATEPATEPATPAADGFGKLEPAETTPEFESLVVILARQMNREADRIRLTVIHECAHDIVGRSLGYLTTAVSIDASIEFDGVCYWRNLEAFKGREGDLRRMVASSVGYAAEAYLCGQKYWSVRGSDRDRIEESAMRIHGRYNAAAISKEISLAHRRAENAVRWHWPRIIEAATHLLRFNTFVHQTPQKDSCESFDKIPEKGNCHDIHND